MSEHYNLVFELDKGEQVLVTFWPPDHATIAFRDNSWNTWSPPSETIRIEKIDDNS